MSQSTHDFALKLKHYFYFLWLALTNREPYAKEREALNERVDKAADSIKRLKEVYLKALENWDKEIKTYQALVENLRENIRDKDALLDEYRKQLAQYESGDKKK